MKHVNGFKDFLSNIRPTDSQLTDFQTGHKTLRNRLADDDTLKKIIIANFLQGSYRRATAVRPKGESKPDVDIIVVTNLDKAITDPADALEMFVPFVERHYKGKYRIQGRSIGIELSYVNLDLVITSAPSEVEAALLTKESDLTVEILNMVERWKGVTAWADVQPWGYELLQKEAELPQWKQEPLYIPDAAAAAWQPTHPLAQIQTTWQKNEDCNTHFVNVVKALKWWRLQAEGELKHPKSYPLERLIGECCPDGITSVAEGVTLTLEAIVKNYAANRALGTVPELQDYGVPEHNVFKRITADEFAEFYDKTVVAAIQARAALDNDSYAESSVLWRGLFGNRFPEAPKSTTKSITDGYTVPPEVTKPQVARFG